MATIPVALAQSRDPAAYIFDRIDGHARRIEARDTTSYPRLAVIHEIGHLLDHQALGTPGRFASVVGRLDDVLGSLDRTAAIAGLRGRLGNRYAMVVGSRGRRQREEIRPSFVRYLLEPEERFARAYAQYIAVRSDSAVLLRELESLRANPYAQGVYYQQWHDDDFLPILDAFGRLFRRQGWIL